MTVHRHPQSHVDVKHGRLFLASERAFDAVLDAYGSSLNGVSVAKGSHSVVLGFVCRHRGAVLEMPKASCRAMTPGSFSASSKQPQDVSFDAL